LIAEFVEGALEVGFQHGGLADLDTSLAGFTKMRDYFYSG